MSIWLPGTNNKASQLYVNHNGIVKEVKSAWVNYNGSPTKVYDKNIADIYGVYWDGSTTTSLVRTDNSSGFSDPNPAINNGSGSSPFDNIYPWSDISVESHSIAGEVVKIPKYYYKWTRSGAGMKLQISGTPVSGFFVSPAHANRNDGAGERDYVYVGKYHCDSSYKSITGTTPLVSINKSTARTRIHNLGSNIWQYDFAMYWTIMMLYLVEYADWNTQAKIGYGCGTGSSLSLNKNGLTDNMLYHTGTNATSRTAYGHIRYRYIEGLWSGVFDICDGIYFSSQSIYCIKNPSNFSDNANGVLVGQRAATSGYIKSYTNPIVDGFEYALYPNEVGGTDSTYIPDQCAYGATSYLVIGGFYSGRSTDKGGFCFYGSVSSGTTGIGCRLMILP